MKTDEEILYGTGEPQSLGIIRGTSPISDLMAELKKLDDYQRVDFETAALRFFVHSLLPRPSPWLRFRHWLHNRLR